MYLMIQNKGIAPVEAFTLLGASTSRGTSNIGQFGTGTKHAINLLLRERIDFRVYSGTDKIDFTSVDSDFKGKTVTKVTYSLNGRKPRDTGWTLDWGALDWDHVSMAVREFVSNAIDDTPNWKDAIVSGDLNVEIVQTPRAKEGYIRVFIALTDGVREYFDNLPMYFLHFHDPSLLDSTVLEKINVGTKARVYRRGVFVRELAGAESMYDYNVEITLNDCRNSSDYACRAAIAEVITHASGCVKSTLLRALVSGAVRLEFALDEWYLTSNMSDLDKRSWVTAWESIGGGVAVEKSDIIATHLKRKGHRAVAVPSASMLLTLEKAGVKTAAQALGDGPMIEPAPITYHAIGSLNSEWDRLTELGMTFQMAKPRLECFSSIVNAEASVPGEYKDGCVYIQSDVADSPGPILNKVMFEELVHHITQSGDCSRDFQSFLIDVVFAERKLSNAVC